MKPEKTYTESLSDLPLDDAECDKHPKKESMSIEDEKRFQIVWSIRLRLSLILSLLVLLLVAILTFVQITSQKKILENEMTKRVELMKENLIERSKNTITTLAGQVENDIAAFDFSGMMENIRSAVVNNNEIKYGVLTDASGMVFSHTKNPELVQTIQANDRNRWALSRSHLSVREYEEDSPVIEIVKPVQISTHPWGVLRLIYSLEHLQKEIDKSKKQIGREINWMISKSIMTSAVFLLCSYILLLILAAKLSRPISDLTECARKISKGDFAAAEDIEIKSRDEVGVLTAAFIDMTKDLQSTYEKLEEYNRTLEQKVNERTLELNNTLEKVEFANRQIMESIHYAKRIQGSILPNVQQIQSVLPESFVIWIPRDVVGGDIYFADFFEDGFIIAVLDCTGHGVPGAFMTMIASSSLKRIVRDEKCRLPDKILKRLNYIVKTSLQQDTDYAQSDDGLDAAICYVKPGENRLYFAGARLPFYYAKDGKVHMVKGDRQSIGYKRSDTDFEYTSHTIQIDNQTFCYLLTDGFIDQLGGIRQRRFGSRRFKNLLDENIEKPFPEQKRIMLENFEDFKGANERMDDITLLGFSVHPEILKRGLYAEESLRLQTGL